MERARALLSAAPSLNAFKIKPPGPNDASALPIFVNGIRDAVQSNWRIGAENGFDLARDLATRGITVIMTSTSAEADYADLIAESPVAGFLAKADLSALGIRRILGPA